ncbi:HET-domain-containing protein [Aspergillus phoenicis ATCC 13157]|uniref:HET-domain-containing protein n=1 Tax=Aspergillus phoenicis ATCC 13157 TaxID=1353007 RepID=A0A370PJY4_ASPPH|nr:HET-domain-containing protein [Aspergillus phoenicis ATCC 13157]
MSEDLPAILRLPANVLYSPSINGNCTENICPLCDCLEDLRVVTAARGSSRRRESHCFKGGVLNRPRIQRAYFHEPCHQCNTTPEYQLCARCKHMRLRHLIQCLLLASHADAHALDSFEQFQTTLEDIYLNLGSVQGLEERSHSCETCRMFSGPAKEVMEQRNLPPGSDCFIRVGRNLLIDGKTVGDVKCSIGMWLHVHVPQEKWIPPRWYFWTERNWWIKGSKIFLGTIEPTHGHHLVSTPIPQQTVDWQKVNMWVSDCHNSVKREGSLQAKPDTSQITGLRVIDTRQRCITIAPAACRYAALSYVWGATSSDLQATTMNIKDLMRKGSLDSRSLPQIIDDAIVACMKMGIGYLWVDRLCILQDDDPSRKAHWLNSMGDIYAQAYVTIIALAGKNAQHGLPGVNLVKRPASWTGTTQGIYLIEKTPAYTECLRKSRWSTRGWTCQEATLSSRRLLFSDTRVFYECSNHKNIKDELTGDYPNTAETAGAALLSYAKVAIPRRARQRLELQIIANTLGKPEKPNKLDDVKSPNNMNEKEVTHTAHELYAPCNFRDLRTRLGVVMAWRCGCFSGFLPGILNTPFTWGEYKVFARKWRTLGHLCDEAHGMSQGSMSEQDIEARFPSNMRQGCPPGSIFVYTQSLNLNPLQLSLKKDMSLQKDILAIEVGDFFALVIDGSINIERINHVRQHNPESCFSLLAISLSEPWDSETEHLKPRTEDFWYDSAGVPLGQNPHDPHAIDLMLVETENGISRRAGLARGYLKRWIDQNPQFQTFHLV